MPAPLIAMYRLSVAISVTSFFRLARPLWVVHRVLHLFRVIAATYVTLAWVTRHRLIWPHIGAHFLFFAAAVALGMLPKPYLGEMGGMLYLMLPCPILGMIALGCMARMLARWF